MMLLSEMACNDCDNPCVYNMTCVECCARLVVSARKDKAHAMSLLGTALRHRNAPPRDDIMKRVRELLESP